MKIFIAALVFVFSLAAPAAAQTLFRSCTFCSCGIVNPQGYCACSGGDVCNPIGELRRTVRIKSVSGCKPRTLVKICDSALFQPTKCHWRCAK